MFEQIVYHPSFHKTGTTSLQSWLKKHRPQLAKETTVILPGVLDKNVTIWALQYARTGDPIDLATFKDALIEVITDPNLQARPKLLISSEALLGGMPGRVKAPYKNAGPDLLKAAVDVFTALRTPATRITTHFTMRDDAAWANSLYRHILTRTRLTEDFETFTKRFAYMLPLEKWVEDLHKSVPDTHISKAHLNDWKNAPYGIATPILDLLEIPQWRRKKMSPPERINVGVPNDLVQEMLNLNKSDIDDKTLSDRKHAWRRKYQKHVQST